MNVTLRQIRVVLAVAQHRSFTGAARSVGLSQSAVSLSVRQVEEELGVRLLDRTTRRAQLTAVGDAIVASLARLVGELDNTLREAKDMAAQQRGTASIAVVPSVANRLMPDVIVACGESYPHVKIVLDDCSASEVIRKVARGDAELGIYGGPLPPADLREQMLCSDAFRIVMRRDDPFAEREWIRWSALAGRRLIMLNSTSGSRDLIVAGLAQSGAAVEIVLDLAQPHSVTAMVAAGIGIAIMPELAAPTIDDPVLTSAALIEPEIRRTITLIQRPDRSLSPAAAALRKVVLARCSAGPRALNSA
jgi:DNA-binding transcriptional LysR family regulator